MARPVVSIIGKPNVGKSTLFNKLVGRRISITEDTPGVTRDRIYQEVEWQNQYFLLMDTGGLDMEKDDIFSSEVETQVDIALETSDLVLFLVDGREGMTSLDKQIASKIKKSQNQCLVVINKVDTGKVPMEAYEFYELNFDEYISISAEQSLGLGDLLDKIFELLPEDADIEEDDDSLKIALIGKPNVGKSSLVNQVMDENRMIVTNIPGTTRDAIDSSYERNGKKYTLIDTAGLRRKSKIDTRVEAYSAIRTYNAIDRSDICIFMLDALEGVTEQDTKIAGYAHDNKKASIIAINKWDLVKKSTNTQRDYEKQVRQKLSFMPYAPLVFISVKDNHNIETLFDTVDYVDNNYSFRIQTGLLNQVIRDATLISPPPTDKGKRLKIFYAQQVTVRPPKIIFYVNDKDLFHFSYQRYLENQLRSNFDFTGVPLEIEIRQRSE